MRKTLAAMLAGLLTLPALAFATESSTAGPFRTNSAEDAKEALTGMDPDALIAVTLRNRSVITGRLDSLGRHSFFVIDSRTGDVTQVAYRNVAQLDRWWNPGWKTRVIILGVLLTVALLYAYLNSQ